MEISERKRILEECYERALSQGKVHNKQDFAELIGTSRTSLSSAFNMNERYLTESLVMKAQAVCSQEDITETLDSRMLTIIPAEAMAGTLSDFAQSVNEYECERMVSPIKGAQYAIKVCGDSMEPEIPNGSQILLKKIMEDQFIEWGKIYCLDTDNGAVIKRIFPTEYPDVVECRSVNPEYPPFTINAEYIHGWYRVLMVLSLK